MSPTIFREGGFRFHFISREEPRMHVHVHVQGQNGEAKFWLEPGIELAQHTGLSRREISEALRLVQEHENDISSAWRKHFPG
jgi:diadenosine tetraphosphate (Ap4A) HIT family hydrolase